MHVQESHCMSKFLFFEKAFMDKVCALTLWQLNKMFNNIIVISIYVNDYQNILVFQSFQIHSVFHVTYFESVSIILFQKGRNLIITLTVMSLNHLPELVANCQFHFVIQALLQASTLFLTPCLLIVQVLLEKYLVCILHYSSTWVSNTNRDM